MCPGCRDADGEPYCGMTSIVWLATTGLSVLASVVAFAEEGVSVVTRAPYRESVFTVREAAVDGTSVVLRVDPTNGQPRRLLDTVYRRDLAFAICPLAR